MELEGRSNWPQSRDLNTCCGEKTITREFRYETHMMRPPLRTADRWVICTAWQCVVQEHHSGDVWITTDEPA